MKALLVNGEPTGAYMDETHVYSHGTILPADNAREDFAQATTRVYPEYPEPVEMRPDFLTIF